MLTSIPASQQQREIGAPQTDRVRINKKITIESLSKNYTTSPFMGVTDRVKELTKKLSTRRKGLSSNFQLSNSIKKNVKVNKLKLMSLQGKQLNRTGGEDTDDDQNSEDLKNREDENQTMHLFTEFAEKFNQMSSNLTDRTDYQEMLAQFSILDTMNIENKSLNNEMIQRTELLTCLSGQIIAKEKKLCKDRALVIQSFFKQVEKLVGNLIEITDSQIHGIKLENKELMKQAIKNSRRELKFVEDENKTLEDKLAISMAHKKSERALARKMRSKLVGDQFVIKSLRTEVDMLQKTSEMLVIENIEVYKMIENFVSSLGGYNTLQGKMRETFDNLQNKKIDFRKKRNQMDLESIQLSRGLKVALHAQENAVFRAGLGFKLEFDDEVNDYWTESIGTQTIVSSMRTFADTGSQIEFQFDFTKAQKTLINYMKCINCGSLARIKNKKSSKNEKSIQVGFPIKRKRHFSCQTGEPGQYISVRDVNSQNADQDSNFNDKQEASGDNDNSQYKIELLKNDNQPENLNVIQQDMSIADSMFNMDELKDEDDGDIDYSPRPSIFQKKDELIRRRSQFASTKNNFNLSGQKPKTPKNKMTTNQASPDDSEGDDSSNTSEDEDENNVKRRPLFDIDSPRMAACRVLEEKIEQLKQQLKMEGDNHESLSYRSKVELLENMIQKLDKISKRSSIVPSRSQFNPKALKGAKFNLMLGPSQNNENSRRMDRHRKKNVQIIRNAALIQNDIIDKIEDENFDPANHRIMRKSALVKLIKKIYFHSLGKVSTIKKKSTSFSIYLYRLMGRFMTVEKVLKKSYKKCLLSVACYKDVPMVILFGKFLHINGSFGIDCFILYIEIINHLKKKQ